MHSLSTLKKKYNPISIPKSIDTLADDKSLFEYIRQSMRQISTSSTIRQIDLVHELEPILLRKMLKRKKAMIDVRLAATMSGLNELTLDL
jgi:hypothetical protein